MCDREGTESAKGGGTWGRVPRAPGFSRSFWPSSAHGVRQCPTLQWCSVAVCTEHVPGNSPGPGCSEILLGRPQTGGWLPHGRPLSPAALRSWAQSPHSEPIVRLSRVVQAPPGQQRPSADRVFRGLRIASGVEGKGQPSVLWTGSSPLRLSVHSQAGVPGEQGRGASSSRAAEKSLRVLE